MRHDDAVLVLARAKVDDAAKVLAVLLKADEPLAVALLADINRPKAEALIAALSADGLASVWLRELPQAADAIGDRAVEMKWSGTGAVGRLERTAPSPEGTEGFRRAYGDGQLYWSRESDAEAVTGAIAEYYEAKGGVIKFGFPTQGEVYLQSPFGGGGRGQAFESAAIVASRSGVCAVHVGVNNRWTDSGRQHGWLGFPVSEETLIEDATDGHSRQHFEGGVIYNSRSGAFAVRSAVLYYLETELDIAPFFPTGDEVDAAASPYGTTGQMQNFRSYDGYDGTVYSSEEHGIHSVENQIKEFHTLLGGTSSWLGFPKATREASIHFDAWDFEGGTVFERAASLIAVPAETMELLFRDRELWDHLGSPVSEEQPIGAGADRIQFFDNGNVTLRDGRREIWVHPKSGAAG
jgi:uncharacterized protein with LGFP repeats